MSAEQFLNKQILELRAQRAALAEENARLREALEGLLRDVACDWYVKQFREGRAIDPSSTGVVAEIANLELERRAVMAFERLRTALSHNACDGKPGDVTEGRNTSPVSHPSAVTEVKDG